MENRKTQVTTPGEGISVLIQVAELAQKSGILTLDDAVIVKSAIDFFNSMAPAPNQPEGQEIGTEEKVEEDGPKA